MATCHVCTEAKIQYAAISSCQWTGWLGTTRHYTIQLNHTWTARTTSRNNNGMSGTTDSERSRQHGWQQCQAVLITPESLCVGAIDTCKCCYRLTYCS